MSTLVNVQAVQAISTALASTLLPLLQPTQQPSTFTTRQPSHTSAGPCVSDTLGDIAGAFSLGQSDQPQPRPQLPLPADERQVNACFTYSIYIVHTTNHRLHVIVVSNNKQSEHTAILCS